MAIWGAALEGLEVTAASSKSELKVAYHFGIRHQQVSRGTRIAENDSDVCISTPAQATSRASCRGRQSVVFGQLEMADKECIRCGYLQECLGS